jgi:type II secretory pathway predicted ATPase ExeA
VIDKMQAWFGFEAMPFGRDLSPAMLHRHASHAEAAARIAWTIGEKTLGVITGEVGTGKSVAARAALAAAKLGARDRVQLVIAAYEAGLVPPSR